MIDCIDEGVRDALPDFVHGKLSELDRATLTAHVEGCGACSAEVALLRAVRSSASMAPAIDVARIVASLPVSLRIADVGALDHHSRPKGADAANAAGRRALWRIAAAVAVISLAGLSVVMGNRNESDSVAAAAGNSAPGVLPGTEVAQPGAPRQQAVVEGAAGTEGRAVAEGGGVAEGGAVASAAGAARSTSPGIDQSNDVPAFAIVAGLENLSDEHLELLLNEMDTIESIPSSEPEGVALPLENLEGIE